MTLKKLILNPYNTASLYKETLVGNLTNEPSIQKENIAFLGKNLKKVMLIVNDENHFFVSEDDLQFLSKILGACKLTIEDVCIINIAKRRSTFLELAQQLHPEKFILFGVSPNELNMSIVFPAYHLQLHNNIQCLIADPISAMVKDTVLKSKLWLNLKTMFLL